jgi:hypothetical protein
VRNFNQIIISQSDSADSFKICTAYFIVSNNVFWRLFEQNFNKLFSLALLWYKTQIIYLEKIFSFQERKRNRQFNHQGLAVFRNKTSSVHKYVLQMSSPCNYFSCFGFFFTFIGFQ